MKTLNLISLTLLLFIGCGENRENRKLLIHDENENPTYQNLLKKESGKNEQVDSIFYGIYLKMTANSFYEHCNKMFKKGIFYGSYDYQVVVNLKEPFKRPVILRFYPTFDKPFISKLLCSFIYKGASLYKKLDRANVLMKELVPIMMIWYGGNEFIEIPSGHPLKGPKYIKVDANRKITLSENDNGTNVEAIFEDIKPLN
jgi:hypothetical protein